MATGVSNCYVFKSRLQEYAQKAGIPTPVYETLKEGPSHEPCFRSTVIVNNVRYDSLPGFFNRKAAEQSAAEIALMELHKSGNMAECIPQPIHETGLCKNLLQEYAQKMNYAIPLYICNRQGTPGNSLFVCTVEIGGIQYIGAAAKTKKEAEIKAARTALLAIQSKSGVNEENPSDTSIYTVVPCKKKGSDSDVRSDTAKAVKPKKADFKKKGSRKKFQRKKGDRMKTDQNEQGNANKPEEGCGTQVEGKEMVNVNKNFPEGQHNGFQYNQISQGITNMECYFNSQFGGGPGSQQNEQVISHGMVVSVVELQQPETLIHINAESCNAFTSKLDHSEQGIFNMGATHESQTENQAALFRVQQDAQDALVVNKSSLGASAAQGIANNPILTEN